MLKADELSILIVDDTPANLRILSQLFEERGYRVRIANSGRRALEAAASNPPDLILLDIMMPEISGYEVCKQLKNQPATSEIPVIFISALDSTEDKVNAFAVGGVDYVTKPFHFEEVLARVTTHLSIRALQKRLEAKNRQLEQEIAERQRAEAGLQESEAQFRQLVENAGDGIYRVDTHWRFMFVNPGALRILGYTRPEELLGTRCIDTAFPEWRHKIVRFYHQQLRADAPSSYFEYPILTRDGREVWIGQNVHMLKEDGKVIGFQAVARDITAIRQVQAALALARDQALEASHLKSQFLARVTHELRTPLVGVLGYAELLRDDDDGSLSPSQKDSLARIISSASYLSGMVNELLDQAQLEARGLTLRMENFSPTVLLQQIQARMEILASKKGIGFSSEISPTLPQQLYGDEQRLQQVIINLAGNAIKFTKTGDVRIRLFQPDPGHWAIQVRDTGIGIAKDAQPYIFEPFRQLDNAITRESQGTGLGLAIVKQLVELMDGQVSLESGLEQGSTFTVTLPIVNPPGSPAAT